MSKTDAQIYLYNEKLKAIFKKMNLNLDAIFQYTPRDLALENRRMENLLKFVEKFRECQSWEVMDLIGMPFPPVHPGISPESDQHRFELWLAGKPTSQTITKQLADTFQIKPLAEIPPEKLPKELENLAEAMSKKGYYIGLNDGIPDELVYEEVFDWIGEDHLMMDGSGLGRCVFDGCSGYCPGCFQRPWCDTGNSSCWTEDEEAGKMFIIEELQKYVSPSPQSLTILQELQAKEDKARAAFSKQLDEENPTHEQNKADGSDFIAPKDLPFNLN